MHLRSRRLALSTGEASFDVAHAPWHRWLPWLQRPFAVQAGAVRVLDIGTVFQIRRRGAPFTPGGPGRTDIAVLQGLVSVHPLHGTAPAVRLAAGDLLRVPDDAAATGASAVLPAPERPGPAAMAAATAWREGRLLLEATPLADAVAEMQRQHAAPIVIADEQAAGRRISGVFDLDRIDQAHRPAAAARARGGTPAARRQRGDPVPRRNALRLLTAKPAGQQPRKRLANFLWGQVYKPARPFGLQASRSPFPAIPSLSSARSFRSMPTPFRAPRPCTSCASPDPSPSGARPWPRRCASPQPPMPSP